MTEARLCACGCGQPTKLAARTNKCYGHIKGEPLRFLRGHTGGKGKGQDRSFRDAENQTCSICKVLKPLAEFYRNRSRDTGYATECKRCVLERVRKDYKADPEKHREKSRAWRDSNPDYQREYGKRAYAEHREELLAAGRRRYREQREDRIARARRWQEANPERVAQSRREWRRKNLEKARALDRLVALRRRGTRHLDNATKEYAYVLLGDPCCFCGDMSRMPTMDHIVPLISGGESTWTNLTAACKSCNSSKNDRKLLVFMAARR